jgi:hypothetical protein
MSKTNEAIYRIHPGIGVARLGDSHTEFCISPEKPAALPIACDEQGNPLLSPDGVSEVVVTRFKDAEGRIKRQASRFQICVYDRESPDGRAIKIGDPISGGGNHGVLVDIQWQVYLANKKAVWYEFKSLEGEHGYGKNHKRRNADITDPGARQQLIIDPGPQVVNATTRRTASFSRDQSELYAATFPPELNPRSINTLGELKTDNTGRLLVLGGHGHSGTAKSGLGQPRIDNYANNDGWFDDTSDGVVMARLVMYSSEVGALRFIDVEYPAWVIVGYPSYVPEILNIVTIDDVLYDLAIRQFAYRTDLYGEAGTFENPPQIDISDAGALMHWKRGRLEWNPGYKPWFYRDVWPILFRADEMTHLTNVLEQSNYPHNQTERGNFDPDKLSQPPVVNRPILDRSRKEAAVENHEGDLLLESLEPAFAMLVDTLRPNLDLSAVFIEQVDSLDLRERLKNAAAAFAKTAAGGAKPDDPDEYLRSWKETFRHAQESPDADGKYDKAGKQLQRAAKKILDELRELYEKMKAEEEGRGGEKVEPPVVQPLLAAVAARRESLEEFSEKTSPQSIEGAFDRYLEEFRTGKLLESRFDKLTDDSTYDTFRIYRMYLFELLRQPGEENAFRLGGQPNNRMFNLPLMPLLAGDNPLTNVVPSKFLRLTDHQLFILRQWAHGKFYNEYDEGWIAKKPDPFLPYRDWTIRTPRDLDQAVLMNLLGGAFCPGGEVGWIIRNPSIYKEPYRIKADPDFYNFRQTAAQANANARTQPVPSEDYVSSILKSLSQDSDFEKGLQPGDLTKQMALPWQSDFNECTLQGINVTYEYWNRLDPDSEDDPWMKLEEQVWNTLWWPAHRPLQTFELVGFDNGSPVLKFLNWSRGVPQTKAGDLKMVTEWPRLGFVIRNPYLPEKALDQASPDKKYISVERAKQEDE